MLLITYLNIINLFSALFMYSIVVIVINVKKQWGPWSVADYDLKEKTVQSITGCPADEKANNNGSAITILTQYDNCCFDCRRVGNRVISFLFSYFFSNHYFKRSKEFSKFTGKFGRATV
jgi:hypothetical protein